MGNWSSLCKFEGASTDLRAKCLDPSEYVLLPCDPLNKSLWGLTCSSTKNRRSVAEKNNNDITKKTSCGAAGKLRWWAYHVLASRRAAQLPAVCSCHSVIHSLQEEYAYVTSPSLHHGNFSLQFWESFIASFIRTPQVSVSRQAWPQMPGGEWREAHRMIILQHDQEENDGEKKMPASYSVLVFQHWDILKHIETISAILFW